MVQIVHFDAMPWSEREERHREGSLAFKNLFKGEEGDPNNFRWVLSKNGGDYKSPHHKHNFDQVRFCVRGSANIAPGRTLEEGDVGFFPEGTPYGPQRDPASERMTLVFQGGGASGLGYMSARQLRHGLEQLEQAGTFANGMYRANGREDWRDSYEAIWEYEAGRPMEYPPLRYESAILMRAPSFAWTADAVLTGVSRKRLGTFTERATRVEMLRIDEGRTFTLGEPGAMVLAFVIDGEGTTNGEAWTTYSAFRVDSGETLPLRAARTSDIFTIVLPVIPACRAAPVREAALASG